MGVTEFLEALKTVIMRCLSGMKLPVNPDTGEYEESHNIPLNPTDGWGVAGKPEDDPDYVKAQGKEQLPREKKRRAPDVYLMNLPEREDVYSRIPYLLVQQLKIHDIEDKEDRDKQSTADIRVIIVIYCEDGQDGGLAVWEIIERIRLTLQKGMLLDQNYMLQRPFEAEVYPDDTGNYYLGEINMVWSIPVIERTEFYIEEVYENDEF